MKKVINYNYVLILLLLAILPPSVTTSTDNSNSWSEDFSAGVDEWIYNTGFIWESSDNYIWHENNAYNFTIENGMLKAKSFSTFGYVSLLYHNSTIAYGEWNVDYLLPNVTSMIHTAFMIMWTDKNSPELSIDGHIESAYLANVEGYAVFLTSTELGTPTIKLIKYTSLANPMTETLAQSSDLTNNVYPSNLHLRITRALDGNFTVYGNGQQLFTVINNDYTTAEYLGLGSWRLGFQLDNVSVDELPPTTTPPTTSTTPPTTSTKQTATSSSTSNTSFEMPWIALTVLVVYIGGRRRRKIV